MADKSSYPYSETEGDSTNKKLKGSYKVPGDQVFHPSENFNKGLEIKFKEPCEIKSEVDFEVLRDTFNSSTPQSTRVHTKITAPANTPRIITIKKEITIGNTIEIPLAKVSAHSPTTIKLTRSLNKQISEGSDEIQVSADENANEGNVIRLTTKNISNEERKRLRAKRFNMAAESSPIDEETITRTVPNHVLDRANIFGNNPTPIFKTLKKRAERFGENVSSVMKNLEHKEKMLKRKLKFLDSVTNLKELEMEKPRAERFGVA